ncbi:hypothetical protein BA700_04465 [Corynebacterium stationis]|nr:hypothetical protein AW169_04465 [Corynebacterium stationis]AQX70700.1 hypothetical protein CA21670_03645 [Corynebacterium stationis]ASJ18389.1 hypothetical protein BA700_04465 [Corynebacterium stationis]
MGLVIFAPVAKHVKLLGVFAHEEIVHGRRTFALVTSDVRFQENHRMKCRLLENIDEACPRELGESTGNWSRGVVDKGRLDS